MEVEEPAEVRCISISHAAFLLHVSSAAAFAGRCFSLFLEGDEKVLLDFCIRFTPHFKYLCTFSKLHSCVGGGATSNLHCLNFRFNTT